ncbi:TatD family hydrolase [Kushneria marisflavi]|uniref:Hydrolase TatD n=1 Tax=Kushneria marisflavi TaxID=157779 RepID=A0A240UJY0_9GAMM|nr:TatD family hydrolase [Kushneria marisflavi]ART61804.1 hydrolase TatD [Kushneria marisflavi]RKD86837.1 TatD DNase family protein [Kushneria marisflavi]
MSQLAEQLSWPSVLIDSHCHLDRLDAASGSVDEVLSRARESGVRGFLAIATTLEGVPGLAEIGRRHDDVFFGVGVHPMQRLDHEPTLEEITDCIERFEPVAVGEIGLDFQADDQGQLRVPRDVQLNRFERHLQAAREAELPISVHTRAAREETLDMIERHIDPKIGGVLHCFTEDLEMARRAVAHGFMISLSGIVTFASAENVRALARALPLDRLLLETDSPWLSPVPYRGRANEPARVLEVARAIARERNISLDEVAMQTTANFHRLFRRTAPSHDAAASFANG